MSCNIRTLPLHESLESRLERDSYSRLFFYTCIVLVSKRPVLVFFLIWTMYYGVLYPKVLTLVNILFNNRIILYTGVLMSRASGSARAVGEPMRRSAVWTRTYKRVQILFRYIFLSLSTIIKTLLWSTKRKADLGHTKKKNFKLKIYAEMN